MTQVTGDYTALYIDNSAQDNGEWYEHVYYWKVPQMDTRDMKFGCHEYIEFGNKGIMKNIIKLNISINIAKLPYPLDMAVFDC